jgi:23S rRNA (pseudouridine1915-N3)-methyltransferase
VKIHLVSLSKSKGDWADKGVEEYSKRIGRYLPFKETRLKPTNGRDPNSVRDKDSERILGLVGARDWLVVLDERGSDLTSEGLSSLFEAAIGEGVGDLIFCIGGPYGHNDAVRLKSKKTIRLSAMVLNHKVARVMLVEQLYRACAIRAGHPYHHTT